MKLSIVIALYNTELYIEKCIRSIYEGNPLDGKDFEVIVINDGSTDNSKVIVESLLDEYANLKLVNKENGGQSSARNIGFDMAGGTYLFCLDSDDFIDAKALCEALEYCCINELDMLPISYAMYDDKLGRLPDKKDLYPVIDRPISGGEFMDKFVIAGSMWRYIYKLDIMRKYSLKLTEGIFHEDEEFVMKFMSYANKISYQRHQVYNHVVWAGSTVNKKDAGHRRKLLGDLIAVIKNLDAHRTSFDKISLTHKGLSKKIEQLCVAVFFRMKSDKLKYEETELYTDALCELGLYPLKTNYLSYKFRIVAALFNVKLFRRLFY